MFQEGWALAYIKYSAVYRQLEEHARVNQRGLWHGAFIAPWDWRHRNNKTVIFGAFSVPINSQAILLGPAGNERTPSSQCTIKGNISRDGERIYHTEHQNSYARIRMDNGSGRRSTWRASWKRRPLLSWSGRRRSAASRFRRAPAPSSRPEGR
jgi:hypothetical protein